MTPNCPICENQSTQKVLTVERPDLGDSVRYQVEECKQCTFHFANGPIDPELLERVYSKGFHSSKQQSATLDSSGKISKESWKFPIIINANRRVQFLKTLKPKGRILDVGAGRGYFAKMATETFDAEGAELSESAAQYGRDELGLTMHSGDFLEAPIETNSYSIITLWDVLACFSKPKPVIEKIYSLLEPGGFLVMTVPDADSMIAKSMGKRWP